MKKNRDLVEICLLAGILLALALCGCATLETGKRDLAPAVKTAAYVGTVYALEEHPEWRDGFATAEAELAILERAEQIDFVTVLGIVHRLPVKELKSRNAAVIITSATILLSEYGSAEIPLEQLEKLRPVVAALRAGIAMGLEP